MKRILVLIGIVLITYTNAFCQIFTPNDIEKYISEYKDMKIKKLMPVMQELSKTVKFDDSNRLIYTEIIECPGKTKESLYTMINYWVSSSFNDANSVIQLNDKDKGCIICQTLYREIASNYRIVANYKANVKPVIKIDIKEEKIRISITIDYYIIDIYDAKGLKAGSENVLIKETFPFVDGAKYEKTACKAFMMTNAYMHATIDKIRNAVTNGISGNENDDW